MNIAKLKNKAEGLVTQITAKDECEKRVLDAISNNKYAAPRSLLNEVAEDTFSHDSYSSIMRLVWKTIESPPRNWRSIAKALILLDHLVKNGAEKVVADVQQHIHDITYLNEFRYMEGHLDRGSGVREKAQDLASLVRNPDRIHAERRRAKDLRSQYSGYGADVPPRLSSGSGSSGGTREFPSSVPRDTYASRGVAGGGGQGRDSGEISDDWTAGYDRSPTPPPIEARRVIGRDSGGRSQSIDFDEGREGYSGRLSQYQEQEKREASLASQPRRGSRDSSESKGAIEKRTGSGSSKGAASSRKRADSNKSSGPEPSAPGGHDLLSGDDPFPVAAPSRPENDFSSFASFAAPQMLQGGAPVASGGWTGGGGMPQQQQQWTAPLSAQTGQLVPYGQGAPGPGVQQQQQQQQQPMQMQHEMQPQAQTGWGQQTIQGQQGSYGQAQGGQYAGQQGMQFPPQQQQFGQSQQQQQQQQQQYGQPQQQQYGQPQQQQYGQPQQQQTQPQQQQMQQQYQQQQQPAQPQQGYSTPQQPHQQQQQQPYQQQQQPYQQQQQQPYQQQQQPQQPYRQEQQPIPDQQQPFHPRPQQPQGQLVQQTQQTPQPPPAQQLQQPQAPHSQAQQPQPLALPLHAQQPPAGAQQTGQPAPAAPQQQQQQQQQHFVGSDSSQPPGPDPNANTASAEKDWVATEVVRAGIGGIDLAAAVGGLRQTGFKPSDVGGGKTEFSGQGLRGSDGRHVGAPPLTQQRAAYPAPPQPSVEYVEADQEGQEVVVQASTREFLGARSGLKNTGLSTRLQETPQQQVPNPSVVASPAPTPSYQGLPQASGGGGTGAGQQWQGLPQQQGHGGVQTPSWQARQGGLRSTGLMASGGGGAEQVGGAGQAQGSAPAAPWQQGTAGLRRTGL